MFHRVVVPVDGSSESFEAVPIACRLAAAVDGKVDVVTVVDRLADVALARDELERGMARLAERSELPVEPVQHVLARDSVAAAVSDYVESISGATIVMRSHGHGRSAAVLGSTADEILRELFGPIVVIGPRATEAPGRLDGSYVVPLDGSDAAESMLAVAGPWAIEFGGTPWLVEVVDAPVPTSSDIVESSYVHRRADALSGSIDRPVEYEVLHHAHPARAIVDFADGNDASLIFVTTHGRTGLARLRLGSVAAEVVRHATCPVVMLRPPTLPA